MKCYKPIHITRIARKILNYSQASNSHLVQSQCPATAQPAGFNIMTFRYFIYKQHWWDSFVLYFVNTAKMAAEQWKQEAQDLPRGLKRCTPNFWHCYRISHHLQTLSIIIALSTAALSYLKPASTRTYCNSCGAQDNNVRKMLYACFRMKQQ